MLTKEQEALIEDNAGFVSYMIYTRLKGYLLARHVEPDDAYQQAMLRLVEVIDRYDPKRAKFITWASRVITNSARMLCRQVNAKRRGMNVSISLDKPITIGPSGERVTLRDMIPVYDKHPCETDFTRMREIFREVDLSLNERRALLMAARGCKQRVVGETLGLSQSYVSRLVRNARRKLRRAKERDDQQCQELEIRGNGGLQATSGG